MRFKVPQDVQRDDTIIGPITLKQMAILGIGFMIDYGLYTVLSKKYVVETWLLMIPELSIAAITIAFAFVKVHELSFFRYLLALTEYILLPRRRGWQQGQGDVFESQLRIIQKNKDQVKVEEKKEKDKEKDIKQLSEILDNNAT